MTVAPGRGLSGGPGTSRPGPMSDAYDVVVVGARVAGSATALHLARHGHRVAILDRAGPPTDTISTHALVRTGVLQLHRAGVLDRIVEAGTPPIREIDLFFGSEHISFPVVEECGIDAYYAPRRTVLDTALLDASTEAGAEFYSGTSVTDVSRDENGRVDGLFIRGDRGVERIRARHVVGADGTQSRIARAVEARVIERSRPRNAIVYAYFEGMTATGYDFRFVDRRNVGVVPTNDGLTLVFVGGPLSQAPTDGEDYLLGTMRRVAPDIAEAIAGGTRVERLRRANGVESVLRHPAGPGWSLVGDAGFTEDPISAHGMSDALRDAELCAEAVDVALSDPASEVEAAAQYRRTRDRFAVPLMSTATELAAFAWDAPEASRMLRNLSDIVESECRLLSERRPATTAA